MMMKLERDFRELNRFALNMEQVIIKLYDDYYKKDGKFPYNIFDYYVNKYDSVYELMYKRRESFINKMLGNISDNYRKMLDRCEVRSSKQILYGVCVKYCDVIKREIDKYIPTDEDSKNRIYYRLYPVIEHLEIDDIIDLYDEFKNVLINGDREFREEGLFHLQRLFVSFIYIILNSNLALKYRYKYNGKELSYEEVCVKVLGEEVIELDNKSKVLKKN